MTTATAPRASSSITQPAERRLRNMVLWLVAAVLLAAWVGVGAVLALKHEDAIEAEVRQNTNLARALEEQTTRVMASADQATVRIRDAVASGAGVGGELPHIASETGLVPNILVQLSLIDAQGRFVGSNLDPEGAKTGHLDLAQREHVRVHLAPDKLAAEERLKQPDDLFVGKAVLGKVSKRWTIQLSRRIAAPDGRLLGVVVASLDPAYFEGVFNRVQLGANGSVTLVGADRGIRARMAGGQSQGVGTMAGTTGMFARQPLPPEGAYEGPGALDGIQRIVAYRQVAGYPLFLVVTSSRSEALADWYATRNVALVLTALLTLTLVGGTAIVLRGLQTLERTNAALRESEAQANSANQAKTEFLAAISHELRTPLTSIRGFAELMESRLEQPKFREMSGLIRKGAEHLNALLSEILDLAKMEAGAMPLVRETVDLHALVRGSGEFFSLSAADKGLGLHVRIASDFPRHMQADSLRLKQIFNNLLSNAVKFTRQGHVRLTAEREGALLHFHVEDTGPGIPLQTQALIFERFRQGNARVSHDHGGTGLGLALSRALAELMQGTLTVSSELGQGSCFTLTVPFIASEAVAAAVVHTHEEAALVP
jgi:signal transduction histidine kinase